MPGSLLTGKSAHFSWIIATPQYPLFEFLRKGPSEFGALLAVWGPGPCWEGASSWVLPALHAALSRTLTDTANSSPLAGYDFTHADTVRLKSCSGDGGL
jgi:hypothetical protein